MNLRINWSDENYGEIAHNIYRSTTTMDPASLPTPLATLGSNVITYLDETVVDQTTYFYIVSAVLDGVEYLSDEFDEFIDSSVGVIPTDGLIIYFDFESISGSTVPNESPTAGVLDGTKGAGVTAVSGSLDAIAGNFNGSTSGYIDVAHSSDFDSSDYSVSMWVKVIPDSSDTTGLIWKAPNTGFSRQMSFSVESSNDSSRFNMGMSTGSTLYNLQSTTTVNNTWQHVVAIQEGRVGKIYVNGDLEATLTANADLITNTEKLTFGRVTSASSSGRYLEGQMDSVRVYNRALTQSEVTSLSNEFVT